MKLKDQSDLLLEQFDQMELSLFLVKLREEAIKITNHDPIKAVGGGTISLTTYFFNDGSKISTDGKGFHGLPSKEMLMKNTTKPSHSYLN